MNTVMPQKGLEDIFDEITREVTECAGGISLFRGESCLTGKLCTVSVAFVRGFHTCVSFCAEEPLFTRLTQYMMQNTEVTPQDVEDFTKEYFNVLCGHIAARLFRETKISSRFGVPVFYQGCYIPDGHGDYFAINYTSDRNENAQLMHYALKPTLYN